MHLLAVDDAEVGERASIVDVDQETSGGKGLRWRAASDSRRGGAGFGDGRAHCEALPFGVDTGDSVTGDAHDRWPVAIVSSSYAGARSP